MIGKFFLEKKDVVLSPHDFKKEIETCCSDMLKTHTVGRIAFAECHEQDINFYPLVLMELVACDDGHIDYAYYVPQTAEVKLWQGKLNYRLLDYRDVDFPVKLLNGKHMLSGKIAMINKRIVFRFRQ